MRNYEKEKTFTDKTKYSISTANQTFKKPLQKKKKKLLQTLKEKTSNSTQTTINMQETHNTQKNLKYYMNNTKHGRRNKNVALIEYMQA